MRIISFRSVFSGIREKKKLSLAVLLCFLLIGTLIGVRSIRTKSMESQEASAAYEEAIEAYEQSLEDQAEAIRVARENLAETRKQYEDQEKYCQESIYMQLDANAIHTGEVQYSCEAEVNTGNVMNALMSYTDSVDMRERLANALGTEEAYLKEVITYASAGNTLRFIVYHYTAEGAEALLKQLETALAAIKPDIEEAQGGYQMKLNDRQVGVRADVGILNAQNGHRNNLKNYRQSVLDQETNLENKEKARKEYAEKQKPEAVVPFGWKAGIIELVKGVLVGILLGAMMLIVWGILRILFGRRVMDEECLRGIGCHPLVVRGNEQAEINAAAEDLVQCCRKEKRSHLLLLSLSVAKTEATEALVKALKERGMEVSCRSYTPEDATLLQSIGEAGAVVPYVRKGESLYRVLEELAERLSRYDVVIPGGIFDTQ